MFDCEEAERNFCDFFEYRICEYLKNSKNSETKGFWCDGVLYQGMINEHIAMFTIFTGKTGQSEYVLLLEIGKDTKNQILKGIDLQLCLPESKQENLCIDVMKKTIQITLM
jgi:hypothetical protein